ncbi:unnamed protein product [Spirodela intermedia]|uniref:Uncharacterized protein n=1 Tax=Spirodela intermedia TaxID=51605 RepID=A0A7I8JBQ1_SPIIN|nr:unnamed protein product [Spirodela intermedia]CAA6666892.1 unnamed protein product [Spirodela intermedia]
MLLVLRQQLKFRSFLRKSRNSPRAGGSTPPPFSSVTAAAAYDLFRGVSGSEDDRLAEEEFLSSRLGVVGAGQHGASPPPLSSQPGEAPAEDESVLDGARVGAAMACSSSSPGDPRLSLLSECYDLARSGRRRELKRTLHHWDGDVDLVWDSLVEVYARREMPRDALFVFDEMNLRSVSSSADACQSLMHSLRNTDMVWDLYEKIRRPQGILSSSCIHGALLGHLCRHGWMKEAVSLFQDKRGSGELQPCLTVFNAMIAGSSTFIWVPPDETTYNSLIQRLSLEGSLEEALALSAAMEQEGMENGVATFNALIYGFCLHRMMNMVWKVVKMMLTRGLSPGYLTYRALMIGHFQSGNVEEGLKLKDAILARGFQMNIITYNILLHSLCEAGRLDEVERLLTEIRRHGLELDHVAYSTLIHGFCKLGETHRALELSRAMATRGIAPNSYNHLSVLLALCGKNLLREARQYLCHLRREARQVDAVLYNAAVDGHAKAGDLNGALLLLGEMMKSGISPTVVTFNSLVHGLCCCGKLAEGRALMAAMVRQGLAPNAVSYTTLLDAYCREGDVGAMVDLFDEMVGRGVAPNTVTYSVIMKGFCRAGQLGKAAAVLKDMHAKGIPADQIAFNTLIQGFCEARDVGMALHLHDEMLKHVRPTPVTYNLLVNALCVSHNLCAAETLVGDLLEKGVRLRKFAFTALIKAQCVVGSPQKAVLLFQNMIQAGFDASVEDYTAVIHRLCKRRRLKDAKVFLNMMLRAGVHPDQMLFDVVHEAFSRGDDRRSMLAWQGKILMSGLPSK